MYVEMSLAQLVIVAVVQEPEVTLDKLFIIELQRFSCKLHTRYFLSISVRWLRERKYNHAN